MRWPRFATSPKILKVLALLVVVAALKLTLLGTLGVKTWEELRNAELLPVPQALAAKPGAKAAAKAAPAPEPATAESDMLDQNAIPGPKVPESKDVGTLKRREDELAAKERALAAMEKTIDDKLAELKRSEASLKAMLDQADVLKDARIKRQVDTYMAMKPKQAAEVLSNMDQDLAVKILTGMKPKVAGEIMTYVKTPKAAKLTEAMTAVQTPLQGPGK